MPFQEGDPRKQCYDGAKAIRDNFKKYYPKSSFSNITDEQIEENINKRYHLYEKAQTYANDYKQKTNIKNDFFPGKPYIPRFPALSIPLEDIEKQTKLKEAWNGNIKKDQAQVAKDYLDELLNVDVLKIIDGTEDDASKLIENATKYKNVVQLGFTITDFINELERDKDLISLPQDYLKEVGNVKVCYEHLSHLDVQTRLMATNINFLIPRAEENDLLKLTKKQLEDINKLMFKYQANEIQFEDNCYEIRDLASSCCETETKSFSKFIEKAKEKGIKGRFCDYKFTNNENISLAEAILKDKPIERRTNEEIERLFGLSTDYYKNLSNSDRRTAFYNMANEINNTEAFTSDSLETQLKRLATLSNINNEHKKALSVWDYFHPLGWHKRNMFRKEKTCLNNMKQALERKGCPSNLLNKIHERGDIHCVTRRMFNDLPIYMTNKVMNPNNTPAFNMNKYIAYENNNQYEDPNIVINNIPNNINNINNLNNNQNNNGAVIGNMNVQNNNENIIDINTNMNQQNNNNNIISTNTSGDNNPTNRDQNNKNSVYRLSGRNSSQRSKNRPLSTLQAAERKQMRQGVRNQEDTDIETHVPTNERTNNN